MSHIDIHELIKLMKIENRIEAKLKDRKEPKPMPKSYQKSKQFRNQTTLKKK